MKFKYEGVAASVRAMSDDRILFQIDIAREPAFVIGTLRVNPPSREVAGDGWTDQLEPRVLQVLIALHQGIDSVVSRDDLIGRCWGGRIVGDDAINRAIGQLRKLAERSGAFAIDTIPRVGYRLTVVKPVLPVPANTDTPRKPVLSRRNLLIGAGAAAALALAGGGYLLSRPKPRRAAPISPEVAALIASGVQAQRENTEESRAEAIGIFERVTQIAPDTADAWGGLAVAYAFASHHEPSESAAWVLRSRDAIRRAFALDPTNVLAFEASAWVLPTTGAWGLVERVYREGLSYHPDADGLLLGLAHCMASVGRVTEAARLSDRAHATAPAPDPSIAWARIQQLWAANRVLDSDAASAEGIRLFPRNAAVFFNRIYVLMLTGRPDDAMQGLADRDRRPPGVPDEDFDRVRNVALALKTRAPADVERAAAEQFDAARRATGYAENAMQFLCALGRVDAAFAVAEAYYLGRGFAIGDLRFSAIQGSRSRDRYSNILFNPSTKPMRRDPRFWPLVRDIGLERYWRENGVRPDYQRSPDF